MAQSTLSVSSKTLILITGANSGIGYAIAQLLLSKPNNHILLSARNPQSGLSALQSLQSEDLPGTAEAIHLDVTSDTTITSAFDQIKEKHGHLDILINNAAVASFPDSTPEREQLNKSFDTNATGPWVLGQTFLPLLKLSTNSPRVINISSGAGSINRRLDKTSPVYNMQQVQYRASKAALNMVSACQYVEFGKFGIKVSVFDPGFTISNLSKMNKEENGARKAVVSAAPVVDIIEGKTDAEEEGLKFLHRDGEYPW